jgi:hypothetical protein
VGHGSRKSALAWYVCQVHYRRPRPPPPPSSYTQAAVGVVLLMLNIFIDGTHLSNDGGCKALPVYLSLGNMDSSMSRQDTFPYLC